VIVQVKSSKNENKKRSRSARTLKSKTIILGLALVLAASLFATVFLSQSEIFQTSFVSDPVPSAGSNTPEYTTCGWNVTTVGETAAVTVNTGNLQRQFCFLESRQFHGFCHNRICP
jgi:hypothetical protein